MKIIETALKLFKNPMLCFSGGKDSTLMLYLTAQVCKMKKLDMPLILVSDPFPILENYEFCIKTLKKFNIDKFIVFNNFIDEECLNNYIEKTHSCEKCCYYCKVRVLNKIIEKFNIDAVFVAVRWDEHEARSDDDYIRLVEKPKHYRVEPILHLTFMDVLQFYIENPQLLNPLYLKGYTSLGCEPCTKRTIDKTFTNINDYVMYIIQSQVKEREGRLQDKERIMERLRRLGYF